MSETQWRISYVLADHEHNEFVPLGDTSLGPEDVVKGYFSGLPEVAQDPIAKREFLADLRSENEDIHETRFVSAETIEQYLETSLGEAERLGREYNQKEIDEFWEKKRTTSRGRL